MKRFVSLFLIACLMLSPTGFGAWDDTAPAGSSNASDIDTNVTANNAALEGMLDEVRGWKNLKVVRDSVTQVTVTADILYLQSSSNLAAQFSSVSEAIAITTSGASGLDTGAEASGTWYYIWIISKSSDGTINGLLSASATSPTMPSGYDQKTLVSGVYNSSGSDFVDFIQQGNKYRYTTWQTMASGSTSGSSSSITTSAYVPSALSDAIFGSVFDSGDSEYTAVSNISPAQTPHTAITNLIGGGTTGVGIRSFEMNLITADTLYWISNAASSAVLCSGFDINKL